MDRHRGWVVLWRRGAPKLIAGQYEPDGVHCCFWMAGPFGRRAGTEQPANGLQRILKRNYRIVGYHPRNPFENPLEIS